MAARPPSKTSGDIVADLADGVDELKISQATADDEPVKAKQEDQVDSASSPKDDDGKGDVVQEEISFFCWNIAGSESATLRQQVTQATFDSVVGGDKIDVICLQELGFKEITRYKRYFKIPLNEYGYEFTEERRGHYDSILFKEEKFERLPLKDCSTFKEAFQLMDLKKIFYEAISKNEAAGKVDDILERMKIDKKDATTTQESLCDEILSECTSEAVKDVASFKRVILPRYQGGEVDESLQDFVERRAAMVLVKLKSKKLTILVISLHSPKKAKKGTKTKKGQESVAARFAYLLFDFVDKFGLIANSKNENMCVFIAGDFNTDIKKIDCLEKFLTKYDCPNYALERLRASDENDGASVLPKIDFMLFRNFSPDHTAILKDVASPPTITPDSVRQKLQPDKTPIEQERSVANHNALTGTVQVETARKELFPLDPED